MAFMPTRAGRGPSTPIIFVPTLNDLVLSGALVSGVASTGTILNATTGSTITSAVPGLTVNSAARTYSYNGAGSAGSVQGLTETLAGATFSPRNNTVTIVSASIPAFTSNPAITPTSGDQNTTFSAIDGAMSNGGSVLSRRWLLNGTSIGSGTTIVPGAQGSLVLENTGTGGIVATSTAVTVASAGTPTPTPGPTLPAYLGQVASRSYVPNTKSNTSSQAQYRSAHVASQDMTVAPQVAYPAWYVASGGAETPTDGDLTYKVGIEYPAGAITPLTWAGSSSKVATSGGDTGLSDANISLPTAIPAGARFWLRPYVTGAAGSIVSYVPASGNVKDTANGEASVFGTSVADQSATGTIADDGTAATIAPLCIVATTTKPTFLASGDSRTAGSGGTPNTRGDTGEIAQSIGAGGYAYVNAGIGGDRATYQAKNYQRRAALGQYCSGIVIAAGINDLQTGGRVGTDAQLRASRNTLCQIFAGKPIIGTTLAPVTSGTYADAAGQTVDANTAAIQSFNAYMRTVPAPYAAVVDIASALEDSANPGKWKANLTSDGLHANPAGYAAIVSAGVINPATLGGLGKVTQPWSPMQIASALLQFFEADNADNLAADLSLWNSTIGATGLSQATTAKRPALATPAKMGGKAVVAFDGADDALIGGAASRAITRNRAAITIAFVGYGSAGSGNAFLVNYTIGSGTTTRAGIYLPTTGFVSSAARRLDGDAGINTPSTSTTAAGDPFILIVTFNPAAGNGEVRKNGTVEATFNYASSGNTSDTSSNAVTYGAGTETSNYANCGIGAALLAGRVFTDSEKQLIEGAWAAKYGLQGLLPSAHPYKSAAPTV